MEKNSDKKATAQATEGVSPISGVAPPKNRQFGQPEGNPRNPGGWKRTETARWKFEQIIKMTTKELQELVANEEAGEFERACASTLLQIREKNPDGTQKIDADKGLAMLGRLTDQVYGPQKNQVDVNLGGEVKGIVVEVKDFSKKESNNGSELNNASSDGEGDGERTGSQNPSK